MLKLLTATCVATLYLCVTGCALAPKRESTITLEKAFQDIKSGLATFAPKPGEEPLGVWLTDIQVVLKLTESSKATSGGEIGVVSPAAKLSFSSENSGSGENTITLTFKNPHTLGKDTIAGIQASDPKTAPVIKPSKPYYSEPILLNVPLGK